MTLEVAIQAVAHAASQRWTEHHQDRSTRPAEDQDADIEDKNKPDRTPEGRPDGSLAGPGELSGGVDQLLKGLGDQNLAGRLPELEEGHCDQRPLVET